MAVCAAEPPQHLADAGRRRTAAAGDALSRVRSIPRRADHLARRPMARLQQGRRRRIDLDADARPRGGTVTLTAGARLGPYEIQAPLGVGGMGEVYRARDTRLDRGVAVKVLPAELAADS